MTILTSVLQLIITQMLLRIIALLSYVLMVCINLLANALPINNRSTGQISDSYPNLFAPSGITFSIWGVIYLLLAGYLILQFTSSNKKTKTLFNVINPLFIATSIINILWIFAWHYDYIGLSVIVMLTLLFLLIKISDLINSQKYKSVKNIFVSTPFSVYFGWITVATIANITVFLVSINWNGLGISDFIWTSIILVVGAAIGILRIKKDKNLAYGLVLIWAYAGILLKHISFNGYNGKYLMIIATVIFCLVVFVLFIGKFFIKVSK